MYVCVLGHIDFWMSDKQKGRAKKKKGRAYLKLNPSNLYLQFTHFSTHLYTKLLQHLLATSFSIFTKFGGVCFCVLSYSAVHLFSFNFLFSSSEWCLQRKRRWKDVHTYSCSVFNEFTNILYCTLKLEY